MSTKIYQSIIGVMSEIGAISKDKTNTQQGFKYRGIDEVMNTLQPLLIKNNVFVVPEVLEQTREDKVSSKGTLLIYSICKIKFTFYADDGSNLTAVTIGEGMDSGDKATNKAMAIAFKYACFQVFCIPTEEMKDPDDESHELQSPPKSTPASTTIDTGLPESITCKKCGAAIKSEKSIQYYSNHPEKEVVCFNCSKQVSA